MPGLRIPASSRVFVRARDEQRCVICRSPADDWHHRRTRRVVDEHTHCPCNGVLLCGKGNNAGDHGWVHSHPFEARAQGLIISRYDPRTPPNVPVWFEGRGWFLLGCDGSMIETKEPV